jgi:hypothetical protein
LKQKRKKAMKKLLCQMCIIQGTTLDLDILLRTVAREMFQIVIFKKGLRNKPAI